MTLLPYKTYDAPIKSGTLPILPAGPGDNTPVHFPGHVWALFHPRSMGKSPEMLKYRPCPDKPQPHVQSHPHLSLKKSEKNLQISFYLRKFAKGPVLENDIWHHVGYEPLVTRQKKEVDDTLVAPQLQEDTLTVGCAMCLRTQVLKALIGL